MQVTVSLPDPEPISPLLKSLSQQYQQVLEELLRLHRQAQHQGLQQAQQMAQDRDALVAAFERMVGMMSQGQRQQGQEMRRVIQQEVAAPQQQSMDGLLSAIRGVRKSVTSLPEDLGGVMNRQLKARQETLMKQKPAPRAPSSDTRAVVKKLDELELALTTKPRARGGIRFRTQGSNY